MTKYLFFQLSLRKKFPGKCVFLNRRLSVKQERSHICSYFYFLDVICLSNAVCFPSNLSFLWGAPGRPWFPHWRTLCCFAAVCFVLVETGSHILNSEISSNAFTCRMAWLRKNWKFTWVQEHLELYRLVPTDTLIPVFILLSPGKKKNGDMHWGERLIERHEWKKGWPSKAKWNETKPQ